MRILIVGGTKFIGPYVVQMLHEQGHEMMLFNRGKTIYPFPFQVTSIQGDRAHLLSFKDKFLSFSPDVVLDMISYTEEDAKQLANMFHGLIQRIVIISSCDVYRAYDLPRAHSPQILLLVPSKDEKLEHYWDYIYEPDNAKELLNSLLTRYIESQVYRGVTTIWTA